MALVCATRGEVGEIYEPSLATRETLAQVRENELRCALGTLGVSTLKFLDYIDGQLAAVDFEEAQAKVVRAIRELRPDVIFTFGPDGVYGLPDHVAISHLTTAALDSAADPTRFADQIAAGLQPYQAKKLYYRAVSQQQFQRP
ncbi:MAG: PIG-L family deacetylase [Chloroflexi bacterium]|nr:PIG-L family deacetylase [Chloroflexota bacterium]